MGWSAPGDIAIAGFDDQPVASQTVPPLTTIRVRRGEIDRQAARLLLDRLKNRPVASRVIDVGFQHVTQDST